MGITLKESQIYTDSGTTLSLDSGTELITSSFDGVPYDSGTILTADHFQVGTRDSSNAASGTTSKTLWSAGNFNKKISNSKLIIIGQIVFAGGFSYNMGYWWQIGSSGLRRDGIFQVHYNSDQGSNSSTKHAWVIQAEYDTTATGNQAVSVGWASVNGGSDSPYRSAWNPNSSDDASSGQITSDLIILEVAK